MEKTKIEQVLISKGLKCDSSSWFGGDFVDYYYGEINGLGFIAKVSNNPSRNEAGYSAKTLENFSNSSKLESIIAEIPTSEDLKKYQEYLDSEARYNSLFD